MPPHISLASAGLKLFIATFHKQLIEIGEQKMKLIRIGFSVALQLLMFLSFNAVAQDKDAVKAAQEQAQAMLQSLGMAQSQSGEQVEAVNWRELAKLLPKSVSGMEPGKIDGGTYNIGSAGAAGASGDASEGEAAVGAGSMSYSTVERTYSKDLEGGGRKEITIRLTDSGIARMMLQPFLLAIEYDTPDGLLKSTKIGGFPAKMMLDYDDDLEVEQTQYMVLVSDRILVQFEGNEYASQDEVESAANDFPFGELEKSAGAASKADAKMEEAEK